MSQLEESGVVPPHSIWPHAPAHWLFQPGIYMVTAGTHEKLLHLNTPERLDYFLDALFARAAEFGWQLQAWAVMANHYHFIATSPSDPSTLRRFIGKLHMTTAKQLNEWDGAAGRKVWFQYWDSHITFEHSYLARLNYVHNNPVHHGAATLAENYPWCSASWFSQNASAALQATVKGFKTDKLEVHDMECGGMTPLSSSCDMSRQIQSGDVSLHSK